MISVDATLKKVESCEVHKRGIFAFFGCV